MAVGAPALSANPSAQADAWITAAGVGRTPIAELCDRSLAFDMEKKLRTTPVYLFFILFFNREVTFFWFILFIHKALCKLAGYM